MHHLCLGITQILDGEGNRSLHTVQVVVDTQSLEHEERCGYTAQSKLRTEVLLEEFLNQFNALLGLSHIKHRLIVDGLHNLTHCRSNLYFLSKLPAKVRRKY